MNVDLMVLDDTEPCLVLETPPEEHRLDEVGLVERTGQIVLHGPDDPDGMLLEHPIADELRAALAEREEILILHIDEAGTALANYAVPLRRFS